MYGLDDVFNILIYLLYIYIINFMSFYSSCLCDLKQWNIDRDNSYLLCQQSKLTSTIKTYHFWKVAVPMDPSEGYRYLKGMIVCTHTCYLSYPSHKPMGVCVPMLFTNYLYTTINNRANFLFWLLMPLLTCPISIFYNMLIDHSHQIISLTHQISTLPFKLRQVRVWSQNVWLLVMVRSWLKYPLACLQ